MAIYKFIGTEAEIGGVRLRRLGDSITLSESRAEDIILGAGSEQGFAGGAALIPEEFFDKLGFTEQELKRWGSVSARDALAGSSAEAVVEFRRKHKAGLEALHEHRVGLEQAAAKAAAKEEKQKAAKKKGGE